MILPLTHGETKANPGPVKNITFTFTQHYFSCCHWNTNSILAHNKISILTTYNMVKKFDIICISETYLDSTVDDKTGMGL